MSLTEDPTSDTNDNPNESVNENYENLNLNHFLNPLPNQNGDDNLQG